MREPVPFTFGIALTPRANARDWRVVERLLELTLASVAAQTDRDFRVLIAGHERPRLSADRRIRFERMAWPVQPPGPYNADSGRKKHWINDAVLAEGGGLLMLLDADDWVDRHTVEVARASLTGDAVGGVIRTGWAVDYQGLIAAPLPNPRIFGGDFHRVCGSSTVARLRPGLDDPVRRDPFSVLCSHHQWDEVAAEHDARLVDLPVPAAYLVNTHENHSDLHGLHADWRRGFTAAVTREGRPLDPALAARFGLTVAAVRGKALSPT
jgi:hypothetical protein